MNYYERIEQFIAEGYRVFGNIEMETDIQGYEYCSKLTDIIGKVQDSEARGERCVCVIDEAELFPPEK